MQEISVFREVYGDTASNKILEVCLALKDIDFAIGDMAQEAGISRPKAYQLMEEFEKKGIVKKTRIVGRTQLYSIDKNNRLAKVYIRNFMEVIGMFVDDYERTHPYITENKQHAVAEKKATYKRKK